MSYLEMRNVHYAYPGTDSAALDDFSLSVEKGSCVALVGPSGCAKTTVLRLIAGLAVPQSGCIALDGEILSKDGRSVEPEKRDIGLIFQDYALFPHMTVIANVVFGLKRLPRGERRTVAESALELVGMHDYAQRYPWQLSGGQQQRVAVARAMAPRPRLLLLDEPFSNLDTELRGQVRREIKQILRSASMTSILVTHDEADAAALADSVVTMHRPAEEVHRTSARLG